MRSILILMAVASPAFGQSVIISSQQSVSISSRSAFPVATVQPVAPVVHVELIKPVSRAFESELTELQREIVELRQQLAARSQPAVSSVVVPEEEYEVVICSAPWCGGCLAYERSGKIEKIKSKYKVSKVNTDRSQEWATLAPSIPAVFLLRSSDRVPVQTWEGAVDLATIEAKVKTLRNGRKIVQKTKTTTQSSGYAASSCNCTSACTCGCQTGGHCSCPSQSFQQLFQAPQQAVQQEHDSTPSVGNFNSIGQYNYNGQIVDLNVYGKCDLRKCPMCVEIIAAKGRYFEWRAQQASVDRYAPGPQASSPEDVVREAIPLMALKPWDILAELGSGDGITSIMIAEATGCSIVGVEYDPDKVVESRRNIEAAGLSDRIEIIEGDVREFNPEQHGITAVYAYLEEWLLKEIKPQLLAGRVTVCPGHYVDGIGLELVGQCWVGRRADYGNENT